MLLNGWLLSGSYLCWSQPGGNDH